MQLHKLWEVALVVPAHQCHHAVADMDVAVLALHWLRVSVNTPSVTLITSCLCVSCCLALNSSYLFPLHQLFLFNCMISALLINFIKYFCEFHYQMFKLNFS